MAYRELFLSILLFYRLFFCFFVVSFCLNSPTVLVQQTLLVWFLSCFKGLMSWVIVAFSLRLFRIDFLCHLINNPVGWSTSCISSLFISYQKWYSKSWVFSAIHEWKTFTFEPMIAESREHQLLLLHTRKEIPCARKGILLETWVKWAAYWCSLILVIRDILHVFIFAHTCSSSLLEQKVETCISMALK